MKPIKHSMDDLKKLQSVLERHVSEKHGVTGVGIGMNDTRTGYVFRVLVESEEDAKDLPLSVKDVKVQYQVTGRIKTAR